MTQAGSPAKQGRDARPWTTRRLLEWMRAYFEEREVDSPRHVAELLLAHVIGCERLRLYMEVDRPATPQELTTLRALVARAARHEPVQYLVGHGWFFGREFEVSPATLIPRPSTETLVEHLLQWHRAAPRPSPLIADIGTGSGCIAVSLAAGVPDSHIVATDILADALDLARRNAERHGVADRIEFRLGPGLEPLTAKGPLAKRFDVIASNPPYIPDREWEGGLVGRNVKGHEPESALRGGPEGLDVINPLIDGALPLLASGGRLAVEIADSQRDAVLARAKAAGFSDATVLKDLEGFWRVLVGER
jgi:release factor glutamine methyltransferase